MPLNIDKYVKECTVELSQEVVQATWNGTKAAQEQDVAWVSALALTTNANQEPPAPIPTISKEELARAQREDQAVGEIIKLKETDAVLTSDMRKTVNRAARKLFHEWSRLYLSDGLLYRHTSERQQVVLPARYRPMVLRYLHDDMGYIDMERVLSLARERFYWPYMAKEVEEYVTRKCPCIK